MRGQCCICSDLFENNDSVNIAAVPCGHTFHEDCVMTWLKSSSTCPHCRKHTTTKQVIRKLFFDVGDEETHSEPDDPNRLHNELMSLKAKLRQHDREKAELEETKDELRQRVREMEEKKKSVQRLLKEEEGNSVALRKQMAYYETQQKALQTERESYKKAQIKLSQLQHIDGLLNGCEGDASAILEQYGEGKSAAQQLAHFCLIMKREYEQAKSDKRLLKDQLDKVRREFCTKTRLLSECSKELSALREHFQQSEEDLKSAEKEKESMKKKIHHLKRAVRSPCGANSSFVTSLMEDSPALCTPKRFSGKDGSENMIDLEDTPDPKLALTPDLFKDTPTTEAKKHCSENNMKFVRIISASEHNPAKRPKNESSDPNHLAALGSLNIFKKKQGSSIPTVSRKGYDGFGGHMSFTQGLGGKSKSTVKRPALKTSLKNKYIRNPCLPSMDGFL